MSNGSTYLSDPFHSQLSQPAVLPNSHPLRPSHYCLHHCLVGMRERFGTFGTAYVHNVRSLLATKGEQEIQESATAFFQKSVAPCNCTVACLGLDSASKLRRRTAHQLQTYSKPGDAQ
jgi:hypothetical protein